MLQILWELGQARMQDCTGIADQDVNVPSLREDVLHGLLDALGARHVELHDFDAVALQPFESRNAAREDTSISFSSKTVRPVELRVFMSSVLVRTRCLLQ